LRLGSLRPVPARRQVKEGKYDVTLTHAFRDV
jgi:hypothetical protein